MKKLISILLCLLVSPCAWAADVTFDAAATGSTDTTGNPATVNITVGSNTNRALLVCAASIASGSDSGVSAVSWNAGAQTGTLVKTQGSGVNSRTELWIVKNPDTGSHTLSVSQSPDDGFFLIGVISLYNVDQTTSTDSPLGETVTSGTSLSSNVTTVAGDMAVDCYGLRFGYAEANTPGAGQTSRINNTAPGDTRLEGSTEAATGTSTVMSWTLAHNEGFYTEANHVAAAVKTDSPATSKNLMFMGCCK